MPSLKDRIKQRFIRYKIYYDRARQYTGIISFATSGGSFILLLVSKDVLDYLRRHPIEFSIVCLGIVVLVHVVLGRLDHIMGLHHEENRRNSETNPVLTEIREILKRIEEQTKEK